MLDRTMRQCYSKKDINPSGLVGINLNDAVNASDGGKNEIIYERKIRAESPDRSRRPCGRGSGFHTEHCRAPEYFGELSGTAGETAEKGRDHRQCARSQRRLSAGTSGGGNLCGRYPAGAGGKSGCSHLSCQRGQRKLRGSGFLCDPVCMEENQ